MKQGFKKSPEQVRKEKEDETHAMVLEMLKERGYDMDAIHARRIETAEDNEDFIIEDSDDDFSVEFYQAVLDGTAFVIFDGPEPPDYDAFIEHAKKVCGYDKK